MFPQNPSRVIGTFVLFAHNPLSENDFLFLDCLGTWDTVQPVIEGAEDGIHCLYSPDRAPLCS